MNTRPRLLFISPRALFPTDEGGKIRTSNILRHLKGGAFEIILASPAPSPDADWQSSTQAVCDQFISWPASQPSALRRMAALASRLPVSVATDRSQAGARAIKDALANGIDLVVTDFPHAAVLLPGKLNIPSVLFTHNVEAEIYERHAAVAKDLWKLVWRDQARKMSAFEGRVCQDHHVQIAVSARDAKSLRQRYGVTSTREIVTGVDLIYFQPTPQPETSAQGGTIVFTGVMDSPANIDGVSYFLREIYPLILARRPAVQFTVVGRNPPDHLRALVKDHHKVRFTGFVDDIRPEVASADVAVIPLRVGGGTRIKAFESMAMGRPVVSTSIGVEGLGITPGAHFLCADDPQSFADAVLTLLENAAMRKSLAEDARALLEERFTWKHVAQQFEDICLSALR